MAFLFKSKKHQAPAPLSNTSRNITASEGNSTPSPSGAINGAKEKDGDISQPNTPSGNNPLGQPLGPPGSPNQSRVARRDRSDSEAQEKRIQAPMNGGQPTSGPNPALYPWSQRRLTFPSPQLMPFPRYGAAVNGVASSEGDIYLMGGLVEGTTPKGDLWMVEGNGNNLSCYPVTPVTEGPGPRVGHASIFVGNALIVFGGDTKTHENDALDDTLYFLNTSSRQWSCAAPPGQRPAGRYGHSLNIIGSKLYVFGGQVEGYFFNDLVTFDLHALQNPANKWEFLVKNTQDGGPPAGQSPAARTNHTMVSFNDRLYLFGGTNGVRWFNDVWSFDLRTNAWTQLDYVGFTPTPREGHAAALVNDVMYIFGGRSEEGIDLGDLIAFRISIRRWYSFHNMGPAPSPRSGHSMTTSGKQIVVLGGEPSSAPRDPQELALAYILDTAKIRYPNDHGPTSPTTDRAPRRIGPAGGPVGLSGRTSREANNATPDMQKRGPIAGRDNVESPAPGSGNPRLPRASIAQPPVGPPPPGQAPNPRMNNMPAQPGKKQQPPMRNPERSASSPLETVKASERERQSPVAREIPHNIRSGREQSPISSERKTPTQQQSSRLSARAMEAGEAAPMVTPARQRSLRQQRQQNSVDSVDESVLGVENRPYRNSRTFTDEPRSPRLTPHQEALVKELEATKSRNAWYSSELALARKAGYSPSSSVPNFEERGLDSFTEDDRPLIEAFIAMKAELAKMQANVDKQTSIASKRVAEVEYQRDAALGEAAYARAKLAARSGSSQSDNNNQDSGSDRSTENSRRLALALASQSELKARVESLSSELQEEKKARELSEELQEVTGKRLGEIESQNGSLELDGLRAELHQLQSSFREEAAQRSEAETALKLLEIDKTELTEELEEAQSHLENYTINIASLRDAVNSSASKASLMERQLEAERDRCEELERKLLQLRADHEERTAELDSTVRRLKEAEEIAESHAQEAESHKTAFIAGLERVTVRDSERTNSLVDQRVTALQTQVDRANELVKNSQQAADSAADKLRLAEERIAGLETYQEQSSREGLQLRRQLQAALKDNQALTTDNRDAKAQLENQQRDTNALTIQHGALKELLGERGVNMSDSRRSPLVDSPGSRFGTPEQNRLRELEQQLHASFKAHEESKASFEYREQETDRAYTEKLEQLENDYQSAVHYVKGTEKMLKRMKDELSKYKAQTARLQTELDAALNNADRSPSESQGHPEWEKERDQLENSIVELQSSTADSIAALEDQLSKVQVELAAAQAEQEKSRAEYDSLNHDFADANEKNASNMEQLKKENSLLENRALDAERKVTMLLDQVESSVVNYRRQSQQTGGQTNGNGMPLSRTHSNASSVTVGGAGGRSRAGSTVSQDDSFLNHRGSMALDSLANELDALRSHWESTNRNYRLSSQLDFDRTPTKETYGEGLSDSLASWRRRLHEEETRAESAGVSGSSSSASTPTSSNAPAPVAGNMI